MDQIVLQMGRRWACEDLDDQLDQAIANIAKQNMTLDQMRSRLAYEGINYSTLPQPDP